MSAQGVTTGAPPPLPGPVRLGDVLDPNCPSRVILDHLTSKWGVLVLIVLRGRTIRFGELRRSIGIVSERMLAQTLRTLEADGFVQRRELPVVPLHVEYSLTPLGEGAAEKVHALVAWVEANDFGGDGSFLADAAAAQR
jgi:DNA-binding HxlR family transcriptional regulator